MIKLEEFYEDFKQSILSEAESRGLMKSQAFFESVCEELVSIGDLTPNYTFAEYKKTGLEVKGYDYDEERNILSILTYEFFQEDKVHTLTKNIVDTKFKRITGFYEKCLTELYINLEETSEAYSMAFNIYRYSIENKIDKIRFIVLSDGMLTTRFKPIESKKINGIKVEHRIVDIDYIYKIKMSHYSASGFKVDVNLPCLKVPTLSGEYEAYLTVFRGDDLVNIYEEYGQRLLEQNVRTFLQFKGAVNKGIKNTIQYKSDMFFAYNNGITATATSIERNKSGNIISINDFQIVNGGQTTSAIYAAKKISKLDVSNVSVQMKLSVVKEINKQNEFVSKVSEYANTQNKVNKSDFFSNSPFHKQMKEYSQRVWAPVCDGSQKRTRWFYERVRGEYLNEQVYLTNAQKDKYQMEYPKKQLIDKTFLAKSENSWLQKPHIVCKGAQYSFSDFADHITSKLEEDNLCITESYFQDTISRIIMFRAVEKIISNSVWYDGGYRAQTVAYTIAYLSYRIEKEKKFLNFNEVWENQALPQALEDLLSYIAEEVYIQINKPQSGYANVSQWAKKEQCWNEIKKLKLQILLPKDLLLNEQDEKYNKKEARRVKKIDDNLFTQVAVIKMDMDIWAKLNSYYIENIKAYKLSKDQRDLLEKMSMGVIPLPSEKQSKVLYDLYNRAREDGVDIC